MIVICINIIKCRRFKVFYFRQVVITVFMRWRPCKCYPLSFRLTEVLLEGRLCILLHVTHYWQKETRIDYCIYFNKFIESHWNFLLLIGTLKLSAGNLLQPVLGSLVVDGAADRLGRAQDLPHHSGEVDGVWPRPEDSVRAGMSTLGHYPGAAAAPTLDPFSTDLAAWKMSAMVMLPLCLMFFTFLRSRCGSFRALMIRAAAEGQTAIWRKLSESWRWHYKWPHLSLSVLHCQLDGDLQTLPVPGGLHDVLADLLRGESEGTHLGCEGGRGSHLSSHHAELDHSDLIGIKLGRHDCGCWLWRMTSLDQFKGRDG